jgi:tRNA A64-2'-O-ribosylphosphate transferase
VSQRIELKKLTINCVPVMPDALSKTIPIWCAVLNRALFPSETAYHPVQLPPNYLGVSEESQIESRIDGFVDSLTVCFVSSF